MKKFIQNIFSVKNSNTHKVWTILGIKFKFKNKLQSVSLEINKIIALQKKENIKFVKQLKKFNNKCKKDFIIDNINNPKFYELQQDICNFYNEMTSRKFYKVFQNRLSRDLIMQSIQKCIKKFGNNTKIYVLTDIENFPAEYTVISKEQVDFIEDNDYIIILAYNKDFLAIEAIQYLRNKNIKYIPLITPYPLARYFHTDKNAFDTLLEESINNNWHFCPGDFENIFQALKTTKDLEGDFVEIGTFKGDSGAATLNYMNKAQINKKAYFFDTFEGFNYEEAYNSEDILWKGTHIDTSLNKVQERFAKYKNATVLKSNIITDELPMEIEKICVANIDVDIYEAVKAALYKVKDKVVTNGIIICEDYGHTPALIGAQKAVNEFLEENQNQFLSIYLSSGQLFLIKK